VTAAGATTSYDYDQAGNLLTTTLPAGNGHLEQRVNDRAGRLIEVWNKKGAATLSRFQLSRDLSGNPTRIDRSGTLAETRGSGCSHTRSARGEPTLPPRPLLRAPPLEPWLVA
jgi:hypothetical protein